jgi:hypothetical protein
MNKNVHCGLIPSCRALQAPGVISSGRARVKRGIHFPGDMMEQREAMDWSKYSNIKRYSNIIFSKKSKKPMRYTIKYDYHTIKYDYHTIEIKQKSKEHILTKTYM